MRRKSSKPKPRKRSKGKRNHAYEIAKPDAKLAPRPLVGLWQVREGTALSVLLLAVLALLTSQFFTTHRFYVYDAEVRGNRFVDRKEIYDASGLHEFSIFWIKAEQAEAAISNLPGIKEARVTCRLPNRVMIEVVERQTQIVWQRGDKRYSLDDQGIISSLEAELEGMLLVQDLTTGPLEPGARISPEVIQSALELRQALPEMADLQYSEDRGLSFRQGDCAIYLGTGDMAKKIVILNALLQDLASDGIQPEYVDVRFIESPSYR